ncbi:hypothetical protein [Leucobacter sp. wl10]|uniref:hypothetical protein n=1 Tax=Leucobacter sp. wl10 TaxID=2304677 RepID=UPI000E7FA9CE|nr:hypothetical protein [Leucobacter sp. wl10]RGE19072.1 hypothetical protein D1J51_13195 [Leucobacter sp. wl10]
MTWKTLRENAYLTFNDVVLEGRIEYDPSQHALAIVHPDTGEKEVLTVDLLASGFVARPGEVFVKDWSEHSGLAHTLARNGIAAFIEAVLVGPFQQPAYRMRVLAESLVFPTKESHSQLAVLLPQTEEAIAEAHRAACAAASGNSNDAEIEPLWDLAETLMAALQIGGEIRP